MESVVLSNNTGSTTGGALDVRDGASAIVTSTSFVANRVAGHGAALYYGACVCDVGFVGVGCQCIANGTVARMITGVT